MFFNAHEARAQLVEKKVVYTLRLKKRKRVGYDIAVKGSRREHETIAEVFIEFIKEISSPEDLLPYLEESGFKSAEDWIKKAEEGSRFLYRVTRRR